MRAQAARVTIALLALASALPAGAAMYKCQDAAGRVSYSDQPCRTGETLTRQIDAPPPAPDTPAVAKPGGEPLDAKPAGDAPAQPYRRPQPVAVPPLPLPPVDLSRLPTDAQGRPVVAGSGGAAIVAEKQERRGPLNVLAACSALVSRCVKPPDRTLDACFMSAPRCASLEPWNDPGSQPCCPAECWNRYERQRIAGMSPLAAFDAALFGGAGAGDPCIAKR